MVNGKTGTAQTANPVQPTNAWFIAFAPYENREFAVFVFVENGNSGGAAASPIAKYIIENATILDRGLKIELTAIPEAIGRTDRVMSVSFDNSGLTAFAQADADSESAVDVSAFIPESLQQRNFRPFGGLLAPPSFRQDTDRRGQTGNMNSNPKPKFRPYQWLRQRN